MKLGLRFCAFIALPAALGLAAAPAGAADAAKNYPVRPIRLLVTNGPGSSTDTLSRIVAGQLTQVLGQQVVVDNRPGAGSVLGFSIGIHATPDGYTLIAGTTASMTIAPFVHKTPPYDPMTSVEFISLYGDTPSVLVCTMALPVKNLKEFIDYAKARPGKLNMGSAGVGSQSHLAGALFMRAAGITSLHVPYKGGGGIPAVAANEVQWQLAPAAATMTLIRAGKIRALGQSLLHSTPLLPNIPPIAETVPGYSFSGWLGLVSPKGVPKPILDKLHAALLKTMSTKEVKEQFDRQASIIVTDTPAEFREFVRKDIAKSHAAIEAAELKPM